MRTFRKIARIILKTIFAWLLILLLSALSLFIYTKTDSGEQWMARQLSVILTKETGNEFHIATARYLLPNKISLDSVIVLDEKKAEMFHINTLKVSIGYYNVLTNKLSISNTDLTGVKFNLIRYPEDPTSNLGLMIRRLTPEDTTSSKNPFKLVFKNVSLHSLDFIWDDQKVEAKQDAGIDFDHVQVNDLNGKFTDLNINGDHIQARVKSLNLREKSGFTLYQLATNFEYTPNKMEFDHLYIRTPHSQISNYLKFEYSDVTNFPDFVDSIHIKAHFINTKASLKDIAYFTNELINKEDVVKLTQADVSGYINDLTVKNLDAQFGDYSSIKGRVSMKGLPVIEETFIDAKLQSAKTSRKEIYRVFPELPLPEIVDKFGKVSLKGDFTGFITDFVSYGTFQSELGNFKTDLNLKIAKNSSVSTYSGNLELQEFNLGKLMDNKLLGITTMRGKIAGSGFNFNDINASSNSFFQRFDFKGYSYKNIQLDGSLRNRFFNGKLTTNDPNLKLEFGGAVDFAADKPAYDFIANIHSANLYKLNLTEDSISLSALVSIDGKGLELNNLEGKLRAYNAGLAIGLKEYHLDSFSLYSVIDSNLRTTTFNSRLLDAHLKGNFIPTQLPDLIKNAINQYIDSSFLHLDAKEIAANQELYFDFAFNEPAPLIALTGLDLAIADSGKVKGNISSGKFVSLEADIPFIKYKNYKAEDVLMHAEGLKKNLSMVVNASSFYIKDSMLLRNIAIKTRSDNTVLAFDVFAADKPLEKETGLKGTLDIVNNVGYLKLDSSYLKINDTTWNITAQPITIFGDSMVSFPLVSFTYENQILKLVGKYSMHHSYPMRAIMQNMSLTTFTTFAPEFKDFKGNLNGQVLLNNIHTQPIIEAAVFANPFIYVNDTLGYISATANFDQGTQKLSIEASLQNNSQFELIAADGFIDFGKGEEIAIDVKLKETELKIFQPVLEGIFSDLKGTATALINISGTLDNPKLKGSASLEHAALTVSYMNTHYTFPDTFSVNLKGDHININALEIKDKFGKLAYVEGDINIKDLSDIGINLNIQARELLVMNTTQNDNDLFFGTAYGTGMVSIKGKLDNLKMYVKMRTEPGTTFSLPITQQSSFTGYDYIHFVTADNFMKEKRNVNLSGLSISMDLEVTQDALAQIIFDPRVGDILEGRGSGNLRLDINTEGDFGMYGTYVISEGSYRFTAFDVINKSFKIESGSTIAWQGDPYEAGLDVHAAYNLRTSIKPLLPPSTTSQDIQYYSRSYPVEAKLALKGLLLSPEVNLDFEVQELNSIGGANLNVAQSQIRNIKANEQELTKQVVSLLVFNQFVPVSTGIGVSEGINSGISSGVGDLVSNQLNYWLSKFSNDIQVGLDYKKQEEFTLSVSKDFNKERANLSFAYDFTNNNYNAQGAYKIQKDGNMRLKLFSRSNNNVLFNQNSSTVGVGVFMRKRFNSFKDLFEIGKKKKQAETPEENKVTEDIKPGLL